MSLAAVVNGELDITFSGNPIEDPAFAVRVCCAFDDGAIVSVPLSVEVFISL